MSNSRLIPLSFLAALAAPARAAESTPELAGSVGQMIFGLAVVLALLVGSLWLIKRLTAPRGAAAGLKVLGAVAVGARERVVLVKIAEQVLVVGVAPGSVRTLHVTEAAALENAELPGADAPLPRDFASRLRQALERK